MQVNQSSSEEGGNATFKVWEQINWKPSRENGRRREKNNEGEKNTITLKNITLSFKEKNDPTTKQR